MLIGQIEELEWPEKGARPMRVRIRHRDAKGRLFDVSVDALAVDLGDVPHHRETRDGAIHVRLGPGLFVASMEARVLVVRTQQRPPSHPTKKPGDGLPSEDEPQDHRRSRPHKG